MWSRARLVRHGFEHFACSDDRGDMVRREHARVVLASDHVLTEMISDPADPVVLIKGREVAELYTRPIMRHFRDLDVLARRPQALWEKLVERGARQNPTRRGDIEHHHLPALKMPGLPVTVEVHIRVNAPRWMPTPTDLILDCCEPSRTGIEGIARPSDDLHALILAGHAWKAGFSRLRDLLDIALLDAASVRPVETTARELGMLRMWRFTLRLARAEILGQDDPNMHRLAALLLRADSPLDGRTRNRLIMPYLVADPVRVTSSHWAEYRLGRSARQTPAP